MKPKSKTVLSLVASCTMLCNLSAAYGDLLYQWNFNDQDGANTGTGTGGILAANVGAGATTGSFDATGVTGNAGDYSLGASNEMGGGPVGDIGDAATGNDVNLDGLTRFTITMWVRQTGSTYNNSSSLFTIGATTTPDGTSNPGISLGISPLWQNGFTFGVNGAGPQWTPNLGIADGNWHFVAFVYNGNNGAYWGQEEMSALYGGGNNNAAIITGDPSTAASVAANMGIHDGSYWNSPGAPNVGPTATTFLANNGLSTTGFTGNLDDIRIYNSLLTVAEIEAIRQSSFAEVPPTVDLYWKGDVDDSWDSLNWTTDIAGTVPGGALADDGSQGIAFATTGAGNLSNVLDTDQNVRSIVLTGGVGPVAISGTHNLTIGSDGIWADTASAGLGINTSGEVILGMDQVWKNNSTSDLTVSSTLSGSGSLTKNGTGMLRLGGDNLHTGGTIIKQGTLALDHANALGGATASLAVNGGTLDLNGFDVTLGALSGTNTGVVHNSSATPCSLTLEQFTDSTYQCKINDDPGGGAVSLVKKGFGTLTSNSASNFTGQVSIEDGQFIAVQSLYGAPNTGSLGNSQVSGRTITVTYPGTLALNSNNIFGNQYADMSKLPQIIVNGSISEGNCTVSANNYNLIGDITLNFATLTQSTTNSGNYQGYQFKGDINVTGIDFSQINGSGGNHLSTNTVFNVEDVTGDTSEDLWVDTPLIDQSGDFSSAPGGFTKEGAGTMRITAACSYTGDTTVTAGILALDDVDAIPDTGKLVISGGKVEPSGTQVVGTLFFGATGQEAGTWGATGSGADNIDDVHFTGTFGVVSVTNDPLVGYAAWADLHAPGQTIDQDHDDDGVDNGVEYFMGESGSAFTANPAPVSGTVTWPMGTTYSGVYGTDYEVQTSTDLVTWTKVDEGTGDNTVAITAGTSVVYDMPSGGKSFVRLVVWN